MCSNSALPFDSDETTIENLNFIVFVRRRRGAIRYDISNGRFILKPRGQAKLEGEMSVVLIDIRLKCTPQDNHLRHSAGIEHIV
jgi:hypothetical protein